MADYKFKLYICGLTQASEEAVANLRALLAQNPQVDAEFMIVDVLERPDLAETEGVVATPTLVREKPLPREFFVGNLSDPTSIKRACGIAD